MQSPCEIKKANEVLYPQKLVRKILPNHGPTKNQIHVTIIQHHASLVQEEIIVPLFHKVEPWLPPKFLRL